VTATGHTLTGGLTQVEAVIREAPSPGGRTGAGVESLGLTLAGVAHELNSPLGTIVSWSERLLDRPLDRLSKRGLEVIASEAHRAARLARNLLAAGGSRQTTRALVDVNRLVQDTLALRAHEHRSRRVVVRIDLGRDLPRVLADGHQIQQVLLNLVTNAEHAMVSAHGGGALLIRTRHDEQRRMVVLEVHDDGPGLAPHVSTRIFDPFFTTKPAAEGTGLGLTVARGIVREHGGAIRVDSEPGRGASVCVDLPVIAVAAETPDPQGGPALAWVSVLLVEDERELASVVGEALTRAGMQVDHAGDGAEATARAHRSGYDVVICDLQMPGVDGMAFYRAIAAATPALARRVIFVTGDTAGPEARRFFAETGCRVVAKPFRFADLLRAVRETLA
jgi:two-component system NtrC family sensor kinase